VPVVVHVPDVSLEEGTRLRLGPGTLQHLAFADWLELETDEADRLEQQFSWSKPVFWVVDVAALPPETTIRSLVEIFHQTLILTTGSPLTDPLSSVIYTDRGRHLGPCRRQLIVTRRKYRVPLTQQSLMPFETIFECVAMYQQSGDPRLAQIVKTCASLTEAIGTLFDAVVHVTSVVEWILLPTKVSNITETFGRRVAAAVSPDASQLDAERLIARQLYAYRSEAIHATRTEQESDPVTAEKLVEYGVNLLRRLGVSLILFGRGRPGELRTEFVNRLDEAWAKQRPLLRDLGPDLDQIRDELVAHMTSSPVELSSLSASRFDWEFAYKAAVSLDKANLPAPTKEVKVTEGVLDLERVRRKSPELWAELQKRFAALDSMLDRPLNGSGEELP